MKIRALAPWFGGKRTMAPDIIVELGTHTEYFEPFAGALSIVLAKPASQKETVNDLHGDIINLARVISHPSEAAILYKRLQHAVMSEGLLDEAWQILDDDVGQLDIEDEAAQFPGAVTVLMRERAYWFFVASWMGRNGTAGTDRLDYQIAVRWTKNGGAPTQRFRNAVDSLPDWHRRLQNVVILRRNGFDIIPRFEDDKTTAIYLDPPYPSETRSNLNEDGEASSGSGGGRYLHEFSHAGDTLFGGQDDHARLAEMARKFKRARIVVSTYDCPRYRELYKGWTFIDKSRQKHLHSMNGRGSRPLQAPEVLIVNGPSFAEARP